MHTCCTAARKTRRREKIKDAPLLTHAIISRVLDVDMGGPVPIFLDALRSHPTTSEKLDPLVVLQGFEQEKQGFCKSHVNSECCPGAGFCSTAGKSIHEASRTIRMKICRVEGLTNTTQRHTTTATMGSLRAFELRQSLHQDIDFRLSPHGVR